MKLTLLFGRGFHPKFVLCYPRTYIASYGKKKNALLVSAKLENFKTFIKMIDLRYNLDTIPLVTIAFVNQKILWHKNYFFTNF